VVTLNAGIVAETFGPVTDAPIARVAASLCERIGMTVPPTPSADAGNQG
jgi:hypothetical protein